MVHSEKLKWSGRKNESKRPQTHILRARNNTSSLYNLKDKIKISE